MLSNPYEHNLEKTPANYQALTPLSFLERTATVTPNHIAVIHGKARITYAELYARARRLGSALAMSYIGPGDTVSVMLANTPPMLEAHYGVPMTGAVLHTINTRLDAAISALASMSSTSGRVRLAAISATYISAIPSVCSRNGRVA